jgi:uncharacterized protein (TIGR02611 family)
VSERPRIIERLMARQATHRRRHPVFRVAWGAAGFLVLLAGVVMLVTPGPAFVLIPVGLAMLALEFEWAERLLEKALRQAERARAKAAGTTNAQKLGGAILAAGAVAGAVVVAVVVL